MRDELTKNRFYAARDIAKLAILAAIADPAQDKSDWMRIWELARRIFNLPAGPEAWAKAYTETEDGKHESADQEGERP